MADKKYSDVWQKRVGKPSFTFKNFKLDSSTADRALLIRDDETTAAVEYVDFSGIDTSAVTDFSYMLAPFMNIVEVDLSGWTFNGKNMDTFLSESVIASLEKVKYTTASDRDGNRQALVDFLNNNIVLIGTAWSAEGDYIVRVPVQQSKIMDVDMDVQGDEFLTLQSAGYIIYETNSQTEVRNIGELSIVSQTKVSGGVFCDVPLPVRPQIEFKFDRISFASTQVTKLSVEFTELLLGTNFTYGEDGMFSEIVFGGSEPKVEFVNFNLNANWGGAINIIGPALEFDNPTINSQSNIFNFSSECPGSRFYVVLKNPSFDALTYFRNIFVTQHGYSEYIENETHYFYYEDEQV